MFENHRKKFSATRIIRLRSKASCLDQTSEIPTYPTSASHEGLSSVKHETSASSAQSTVQLGSIRKPFKNLVRLFRVISDVSDIDVHRYIKVQCRITL